jgi:predicted MFS family arabinose efflux permease
VPLSFTVRHVSDFHRVLAAEMVSNFGSMLSRLVIPWLATLTLTATPFEIGLLLMADVVAGACGALLLGAVVDRMRKRAVMLVADAARASLLGLLAWLAVTHHLPLWMLVLAGVARGLLTVLFDLARSAWVAQRIDAAHLPTRNAQMSAGSSLAETAAFALGGWLYQWLGAVLALLIDAGSYLLSALCLHGVRDTAAAPPASPRPLALLRALLIEARVGLTTLAAVPTLQTLASLEVLVALGVSLAATSYMIFVARDLGFATGVLGLIFATGGIGALLGAALAPRLGRRFSSGGAMLLGLSCLALGASCIPLVPGATLGGAALLIAHQVIGDGGYIVHDVHDRTLRQTAVSPDLLARVDAGIRTLGQLATLLGAVVGGALATWVGVRLALTLSAALFASAAAVTYMRLVARH